MSAATLPQTRSPWFTRCAWILLDWAASGFSTVLITLVVAYVMRVAFAAGAGGLSPGVVWSWTLAAAMLVSALVAPILSAWADRRDRHRAALLGSVAAGAAAFATLAAVPPEAQAAILAAIVIANVSFDMAAIFTGSLLPRIATGPLADRLSALGFAAGYAGGGLVLVVATSLLACHQWLGLSPPGALRAAFAFTGGWWLLFSLPAAVARFGVNPPDGHVRTAAGELVAYARSLMPPRDGGDRRLAAVLVGSMLVLGAVQTAIAQFSSVALEEFRLDAQGLVRLVLLVQAVALPGALGIGWLAARAGRGAALAICLAGWTVVLILAWFVQSPGQLHALAVLLALVLGGVQSVIRATIAEVAPAGRAGVTFGLVQVGSKLAGAAAGLAFGGLELASGQPRAGVVTLLLQIGLGWWAVRAVAAHPAAYASPSTFRIE
ncbi:MAG: MFS transporter [Planctomycetes bacterium]|nr:MFS transporter [Planctomycetota bacterium]